MEYYHDTWKLSIQPEKKLKVIVIGAGVAGLAAGIGMLSHEESTCTIN